jgi:hypothetical protein
MDLRTGPSAAEGERNSGLITLKGDPGKVFIDTFMTMIAYAFLQHRRLAQAGRKKESTDLRLNQACRPCAKPSSISFSRSAS